MPISPPKPHIKKALARAVVEGLLSDVPFSGPVLGVLALTHPDSAQLELERWRQDVTAAFNSLEEQINFLVGDMPLTDDAASLAYWMAENAETGRADFFDYEDIIAAFPKASKLELLEAAGDLENAGMVKISRAIGVPLRGLRATVNLHSAFDSIVFEGINPNTDAALVARMLLETNKTLGAKAIQERTGWSVRRLNVAMLIVGQFIDNRRKSTPSGIEYAIRSMFVDASERATLRRFVNTFPT